MKLVSLEQLHYYYVVRKGHVYGKLLLALDHKDAIKRGEKYFGAEVEAHKSQTTETFRILVE